MTTQATSASVVGDLSALVPSFERSLRAVNKSPKTIKAYTEAADQHVAFLRERGMPTQASKVRREHVESYIDDQLTKWKPATANNRYRSLAQLFNWLEGEGEIRTSPMAKMKPPKVPEQQVPVLSDDDLRLLLKASDGRGFEEKRDTAIIRLAWLRSQRRTGRRRGWWTATAPAGWRWSCDRRVSSRTESHLPSAR